MNELAPSAPLLLLPGSRPGRDPERSIPRGPRRASPEAVAATQRDRLLDGLVRTVADKGFARARVSDICQAAGVTRPVFYELFDGKEDAFVVAHRHGTDQLLAAMDTAFGAAADWPSAVRSGLAAMLAILASAPAFAVTAVVEADAAGPAGRGERDRLLARFHRFFVGAPDEVPFPRDELIATVVGGAYTALHRWVAEGRARELPALLPTLTYYTLSPFIGAAAAAAAAQVETPVGHVALPCATPDRPLINAVSTPFIHKRVDPAATPG